MPDPKPPPDHAHYVAALRRLTPAPREQKAFELTAFVRSSYERALRRRFPSLDSEALRKLLGRHFLDVDCLRDWTKRTGLDATLARRQRASLLSVH